MRTSRCSGASWIAMVRTPEAGPGVAGEGVGAAAELCGTEAIDTLSNESTRCRETGGRG
jgi:hypothetical protein